MVGLGKHALDKGYKKVMLIAEDYAFPYSQVQGFMAEYCKAGGKVPDKAWVPLGSKDYSSVIAKIPKDVDALLVVLGGADAVNFLTQYEQAGGDKPMVGGSITVDQTVLNYKGKRRESLRRHAVGRARSPTPTTTPEWKKFVADYKKPPFKDGFPSPSLFALRLLHQHEGRARRARRGQRRPVRRPGEVPRGAVEDGAEDARPATCKLDENRQAIGTDLRHRGGEGRRGRALQQGRAQGRQRQPDARACRRTSSKMRLARRAELPVRPTPRLAPLRRSPPRGPAREASGLRDPTWRTVNALRRAAHTPLASGDALVLEGVTRAFGALRAVDDVSLTVAAGERRAILGANGAGKTTLFNAITGDFPPTAGRIRFFGEDITALPPTSASARACGAPTSPRCCSAT